MSVDAVLDESADGVCDAVLVDESNWADGVADATCEPLVLVAASAGESDVAGAEESDDFAPASLLAIEESVDAVWVV